MTDGSVSKEQREDGGGNERKGEGKGFRYARTHTHTHTHTQNTHREREREREREEYIIVPSCGGFQVFDEESQVSDLADGCAAYRSAAENNVI
jgi:hypothetical protein